MNVKEINIKLSKIIEQRNKMIAKSTLKNGKKFAELEKELYDIIINKFTGLFQYKDNLLVMNSKNLRLVSKLDEVFAEFQMKYSDNAFVDIGNDMLSMNTYSKQYFDVIGMKEKQFDIISNKLNTLAQKIGISTEGTIIPNSYLKYLSGASPFREELKGYVIKALAEVHSLSKFQEGFYNIVQGSPAMKSRLQGYWETETHDMFFNVMRATDDAFAQTLNLNFFLYLPDEINTSRPFCRGGYDKKYDVQFESKIGKMFHREEVKEWANQEWSGKKNPYNPIQDMGGWNCRHQPSWITNDMAERIDYQKYDLWKNVKVTVGE